MKLKGKKVIKGAKEREKADRKVQIGITRFLVRAESEDSQPSPEPGPTADSRPGLSTIKSSPLPKTPLKVGEKREEG